MKGILELLRQRLRAADADPDAPADSQEAALFSSAFAALGVEPTQIVSWKQRAGEIGAQPLAPESAARVLAGLWQDERDMRLLERDSVERMQRFFDFATVPAASPIIRQDEFGNYMVVLLAGTIAVDRLSASAEPLRLAETVPGDILGEMSLLDGGARSSACTTLTDCEVAVLGAEALDQMLGADPRLAAGLVALLARKLSWRLRVIGARLAEPKPLN